MLLMFVWTLAQSVFDENFLKAFYNQKSNSRDLHQLLKKYDIVQVNKLLLKLLKATAHEREAHLRKPRKRKLLHDRIEN